MSEVDSSPESVKIPENWKFKERNDPGFKVRQIDLDQGFLAFDLPTDPNSGIVQPEYGDLFFNDEGNSEVNRIYYSRRVGFPEVLIYTGGEEEISYYIQGTPEDLDREALSLRSGEITIFFDHKEFFDKTSVRKELGLFNFLGKQLNRVDFGDYFAQDTEQRTPTVLVPRMHLDIGIFGQSDVENWRLDPELEDNEVLRRVNGERTFEDFDNLQPQQIQNGAVYLGKNRDKIIQVDWKIEEDELDSSKGQFAVVSQTHIPSGIVKTLRAPLRLDMGKVKEAVFSRPPYQKDERGKLVVPWRNIDRIVGASLSYSYPPPSPQK